jgi:hypothetical protein
MNNTNTVALSIQVVFAMLSAGASATKAGERVTGQ